MVAIGSLASLLGLYEFIRNKAENDPHQDNKTTQVVLAPENDLTAEQNINSPKTKIEGSVNGPVFSGNIEGTININPTGSAKLPTPRQIPPPPSDFAGRKIELEDILANFNRGATITGLQGMGGIGKTALALVIAEMVKDRFPDGQIFIEMKGTSKNPLASAEAMANVIRAYLPTAQMPENLNSLAGLYRSVLDGKQTLLLLDNDANREQVEMLLPPTGCAMFITSRQKFTLPGLKPRNMELLPPSDSATSCSPLQIGLATKPIIWRICVDIFPLLCEMLLVS